MVRRRNNRIGRTKTRELSFLRKGCLNFVHGVREVGHLGVELGNQTFQPVNAVEDLDALRMRIESDFKWSAHSGHLRKKQVFCLDSFVEIRKQKRSAEEGSIATYDLHNKYSREELKLSTSQQISREFEKMTDIRRGIKKYEDNWESCPYPATEFLLGVFETLGHVIYRLILLILVLLEGGSLRVESSVLALVAQRVQQLAVGRQQASTVSLDLGTLLAKTEFDGEPIDGRQLLDFLIRGTERRQTNLLRELSKARIGQKRHVTQELVDAVSASRK